MTEAKVRATTAPGIEPGIQPISLSQRTCRGYRDTGSPGPETQESKAPRPLASSYAGVRHSCLGRRRRRHTPSYLGSVVISHQFVRLLDLSWAGNGPVGRGSD